MIINKKEIIRKSIIPFFLLIIFFHSQVSATTWRDTFPYDNRMLLDLCMLSETKGWAIGERGLLYIYNGERWDPINIFMNDDLNIIVPSEIDDFVWIGTNRGKILKGRDGTIFEVYQMPEIKYLAITPEDGIFFNHDNMNLYYFQAGETHKIPISSPVEGDIVSVAGFSQNDVYIITSIINPYYYEETRYLHHFNGDTWSKINDIDVPFSVIRSDNIIYLIEKCTGIYYCPPFPKIRYFSEGSWHKNPYSFGFSCGSWTTNEVKSLKVVKPDAICFANEVWGDMPFGWDPCIVIKSFLVQRGNVVHSQEICHSLMRKKMCNLQSISYPNAYPIYWFIQHQWDPFCGINDIKKGEGDIFWTELHCPGYDFKNFICRNAICTTPGQLVDILGKEVKFAACGVECASQPSSIFIYSSDKWELLKLFDEEIISIKMAYPSHIFASSAGKLIYHFNGNTWMQESIDFNKPCNFKGNDILNLWLKERYDKIYRYENGLWILRNQGLPTIYNQSDLMFASGINCAFTAFISNSKLNIYKFDGTSWVPFLENADGFKSVQALFSNDPLKIYFLVEMNDDNYGFCSYSDGFLRKISTITFSTYIYFREMIVFAENDVWFMGYDESYHFDGYTTKLYFTNSFAVWSPSTVMCSNKINSLLYTTDFSVLNGPAPQIALAGYGRSDISSSGTSNLEMTVITRNVYPECNDFPLKVCYEGECVDVGLSKTGSWTDPQGVNCSIFTLSDYPITDPTSGQHLLEIKTPFKESFTWPHLTVR